MSGVYYAQDAEFAKVDQDLLNSIRFNQSQLEFLKTNGFVIIKKSEPVVDFNDVYQYNLDHGIANYVTIDSILNTTSKIVHKYLWLIETEHLYPDLVSLAGSLFEKSYEYYKDISDPSLKEAAFNNCCFFAVALELNDENYEMPLEMKNKVMAEIELLKAAKGVNRSPVFQLNDDYSIYEPAGYYRNSRNLSKYFKIKEWFSRKSFILETDISRELKASNILHNAKCSLLIYLAINEGKTEKDKTKNVWGKINQIYSLFYQRDCKYNFYDYDNICFKIFRGMPSLNQLKDDKMIEGFLGEIKKYRKFSIQSQPAQYAVFNGQISFNKYLLSLQKNMLNFSDIIDIFDISGKSRSRESENIIKIVKNIEEKCWFTSIEIRKKTWNTISPSLKLNNPLKINNELWNKRIYFTSLGSWIDMTEDKLIGVKSQVEIENVKSGNIKYTRGFVDPYPEIYRAERDVIKTFMNKLSPYKILSEKAEDNLNRYITLLEFLSKLSEKEIEAKRPVNSEEYRIIWKIGHELKEVSKLPDNFENLLFYETKQTPAQAAVIGDNGKNQNIQAATGKPLFLYVLIPEGLNYNIACGPVFSYYEFSLPDNKILTDTDWIELLSLRSPAFPAWMKGIIYE